MAVTLTHLSGKTVGVFGLARSGMASVAAAIAGGASVHVWDDREEARRAAEALGAQASPFESWPWATLDSLVLSPGVPLTHPAPHPVALAAREAGVEIICDVELLWREAEGTGARFVAITGTNGKSTTTALIGHVLSACGLSASVGGNIGRSALDLEQPSAERVYVIEMSSYQLDLVARFRADVAIWLNLTPDHLDRHGDMAGYRRAKAHIFDNTTTDDLAIVGIDEPVMEEVAAELAAHGDVPVTTISVGEHRHAALFVDADGELIEEGVPIASLADLPTLRGAHNLQNAATAFAAARAFGLEPEAIAGALRAFPGLAHRMEIVTRRGKVLFVNDSKATNADAAARALSTFEPIYWIAGGLAKEGGIEDLRPYFPKIAKAYLIGKAADGFAATLEGAVPYVKAGDLARAAALAAADAERDPAPEPVVLLSPACASFDQFRDFEARGDAFRAAIHAFDAETRGAFA